MERYELGAKLGKGGMGVVHEALDRQSNRRLAIKRLLAGVGDPQKRTALFEREYHTLSELAHPRIIEVFDYGIDDEGPYYTMELLEGEDLRTRAPLPWRAACALMRDVASSLAIVHSRGFVHRDVTPRNVRCTGDGSAKLIDFGAMALAGMCNDFVGTPPYVAPEVVQRGSLDARTDLYALGATLYFVLTGRNAYPARRRQQLRDLWRSPPLPPDGCNPEIPKALSELTMQLLSLNPEGRPSQAAEVFERLTGIADLPTDERMEVAQAYLVAPSLVQRDAQLMEVRRRMLKTTRGRGGTLLVVGREGLGRSRFLDAIALEGKLLGAQLLRADSGDADSQPLGVARRLLSELDAAEREHAGAYSDEPPAEAREQEAAPQQTAADADLEELCARFIKAARRRPTAMLVDDAERVDEPSLALLAMLATRADTGRLLLVLSTDPERAELCPGVGLLREVATPVTLTELDPRGSRALLASVFGEVAGLDGLAHSLHEGVGGNPRDLMRCAQRLVDAGQLRYEAGGWLIRDGADAVRQAIAASRAPAQRDISADACELLELLSLDIGGFVEFADYPALPSHSDRKRTLLALDELVRARLLLPGATRYQFLRHGLRDSVAQEIPAERRRDHHRRLAEVIRQRGESALHEAHHLLHAGDAEAAWNALERGEQSNLEGHWREGSSFAVNTAQAILEAAETLAWPQARIATLKFRVLTNAARVLDWELVTTHGRAVLSDLSERSGLSALLPSGSHATTPRAAPEASVDALRDALRIAQQRFDDTPERERGAAPIEAIQRLARVAVLVTVAAHNQQDTELLSAVPSLHPLRALSPAIGVAEDLRVAIVRVFLGQRTQAIGELEAVLASQALAQMERFSATTIRRAAIGYLRTLYGMHGMRKALADLQRSDVGASVATAVRLIYFLAVGDLQRAAEARRDQEIFYMQAGVVSRQDHANIPSKLHLMAESWDLIPLKQTLDEIEVVVERYPGWRFYHELAQAQCLRVRGATRQACEQIERLLGALPTPHVVWERATDEHVMLLLSLGQLERAKEVGERYLAQTQDNGIDPMRLRSALALAHAHLGEHEAARRECLIAVETYEQRGYRGVSMGSLYERAARVMLLANRIRDFQAYASLCGEQYRMGKNPALTARYQALLQEATERGVPLEAGLADAADHNRTPLLAREFLEQLRLACAAGDDAQKFRAALNLVVEVSQAYAGFLFVGKRDGLCMAHNVGEMPLPDRLSEELARYYAVEVDPDADVTTTAFDSATGSDCTDTVTEAEAPALSIGGRGISAHLLLTRVDRQRVTCGVVVLVGAGGSPEVEATTHQALEAAANLVREHRDVISTPLL